jgi:hypothetical protein
VDVEEGDIGDLIGEKNQACKRNLRMRNDDDDPTTQSNLGKRTKVKSSSRMRIKQKKKTLQESFVNRP